MLVSSLIHVERCRYIYMHTMIVTGGRIVTGNSGVYTNTTSRFISREHVCTRIYTYTYIHICTARFESGLFQEAIGVCSHIPTANFFFPGSRVYGQPGSFQVCSRKQDVCTQPGSSQVCLLHEA